MTGPRYPRRTSVLLVLAALIVLAAACTREVSPPAATVVEDALVTSIRGEPQGFNRLLRRDAVVETFSQLTQAKLVRIDRRTQELEPWLAESWTHSPDHLVYTLALRRDVRFSDGTPFTSADVVFTAGAVYDPKIGSVLAEALMVNGKPLEITAPDPGTVVVRFPSAFGPGIRLLDNLPILPKHRLEGALRAGLSAGTLDKVWGVTTPPAELAGLGPFMLKEYVSGQRLVFVRNPHYWRRGAKGERLPRLDRLTIEIVPDQNAELLRLQSGQIDFAQSEVRPEDLAALEREAKAGRLTLVDLGVGLDADSLWFNLRPTLPAAARRPWLQRVELRRAVSHAVDRRAFADAVFLGAAEPTHGPVSAGNTRWYTRDVPRYDHDPAAARRLLAGLALRPGADGMLVDRHGDPARFTLITQKGNSALERGAAFIAEELKKVGLRVDVAPLDIGAAVDRIERGDYEAVFLRFNMTDVDPALNMDLWLSSGGAHWWHPSQRTPATAWEREIDDLMRQQMATTDHATRKASFDRAQRVFAEHLPIIHFAVPRIFIALSRRVDGATPALLRPPILWNAEVLGVKR